MSYCSIEVGFFFPQTSTYFYFLNFYYDRRIFLHMAYLQRSPLCAFHVCASLLLPDYFSALRNDKVLSGV